MFGHGGTGVVNGELRDLARASQVCVFVLLLAENVFYGAECSG